MVDLNNHIEVSAISESCQILSDTLDLVEKNIMPGRSVLELDSILPNNIFFHVMQNLHSKDIMVFQLR